MSRAVRESLQRLRQAVFSSKSRIESIASGHGTPGTRAAPPQSGNNDKKIGSRLDNGETYTDNGKRKKRYNFQINKGAEDPTLKKLANKNSHKVWSYADVDLDDQKSAEEKLDDFFDQLEDNLDK
ncbi:hypothetical protein PVAG01_04464 [Phlyctema vagabunda]|uniref:Uncharacterized protein n=1 Tax=Phlyctema vagabunda TaxID=108571 RepID=A0ABR4PPQ9_9HELO